VLSPLPNLALPRSSATFKMMFFSELHDQLLSFTFPFVERLELLLELKI